MATLGKDPDNGDQNEDCVRSNLELSIAAPSDAASESFDSQTWAQILCDLACSGEGISSAAISFAVERYCASHDVADLSWSKAAAFDGCRYYITQRGEQYVERENLITPAQLGN